MYWCCVAAYQLALPVGREKYILLILTDLSHTIQFQLHFSCFSMVAALSQKNFVLIVNVLVNFNFATILR